MSVEYEIFWKETPVGPGRLPRLERLRVRGQTLVRAEDSQAIDVGVFKTVKGHYLIFRSSGELISLPGGDLLTALSQSALPEPERARLQLECEPPASELELIHLFELAQMSPESVREYRLNRTPPEDWDV